jgi:glutamyl-tRNA reductase
MKLLVKGVNHKTAPVEVRERLSFGQGELIPALAQLKKREGVIEGVILSTCNRVEIAVAAEDDTNVDQLVPDFLTATRQIEKGWIEPYLYSFENDEAIRHLFRVAASLDSMVVGEPQILGQLKAAYAAAKAEGTLTGDLETVLTRAFSVAKRVRTETSIGESAVSVSYVAVELARQIFGKLDDSRVMIIGAGKMSELAARHLKRAGASQIFVTNRTHDRAVQMAELFEGSVVEYDGFKNVLPNADIVITSSGAPHYILTKADVRWVIEARRNKPIFLIDIAVPRNIEPSVNELDNVFLYDIDDFQSVVDENLRTRMQEAEEAENIVEQEVERMVSRLKAREVTPTIVSLQKQLEQIRSGELDRVQAKLSDLTPEQRAAVEALTRGLVNKIAHGSIAEIRRQAAKPNGIESIEVIRRVFRLDE